MYIIATIITLISELFIVLYYSLPVSYIIVYFLSCILAGLSCIKKVKLSISGWWLFVYLYCSFIIVTCFKYTTSMSLGFSSIQDSDFTSLAKACILIFFVFFLSVDLFYSNMGEIKQESTVTHLCPQLPFLPFYVLALSCSIFSQYMGIGRMGVENTRLPFHLSGIIQFYRVEVFPLIMLCCYARKREQAIRFANYNVVPILILFFVWALLECFIRYSRSALITSMLPILIYEAVRIKSFKSINIRIAVPVIVVSFVLFPIISTMRSDDYDDNTKVVYENSSHVIYGTTNYHSHFVEPFTRVFYSGYLFLCDHEYINSSAFFDGTNISTIVSLRGSARFQTFVIDGYPLGSHHSSGSTPFIDGFLCGGYGLFLLIISLFVFIASRIDSHLYNRRNFLISSVLCVVFIRLFDMLSITFFIDPMCVRFFLVYFAFIVYVLFIIRRTRASTEYLP